MPHFILHAFFAILSFVGLLRARSLPENSGAVHGSVEDSTGAVIPGATVTAMSQSGSAHTAETRSDGRYRIEGLENGTYTMSVKYTGFQQTKAVLVQVRAGRILEVNISVTVRTQIREITVEEPGLGQVSTEASTKLDGSIATITNQ
jgi:hypothetical protein